jgi:hypothetical protein
MADEFDMMGDAYSQVQDFGSEDMPFPADEPDPAILQKQKSQAFDGPIPGQSMTKPMGEQAHQQPPQFTTIEEAAEFILQGFLNPQNQRQTLAALEKGVPLELMVESMIMVGAAEGKWTIDLGMILADTVATNIIGLAALTGTDINFGRKDSFGNQKTMKQWFDDKVAAKSGKAKEEEAAKQVTQDTAAATSSLLSRGEA